jgi:hypothetical protein
MVELYLVTFPIKRRIQRANESTKITPILDVSIMLELYDVTCERLPLTAIGGHRFQELGCFRENFQQNFECWLNDRLQKFDLQGRDAGLLAVHH